MSVKQRNGRIIIVDHSAAATTKILCAGFHLGMRADKGYVWFLSPWLQNRFWESPEVLPPECEANDLRIMHDFSFSVSHPLHTGAVTHSNLMPASDATNGDGVGGSDRSANGTGASLQHHLSFSKTSASSYCLVHC